MMAAVPSAAALTVPHELVVTNSLTALAGAAFVDSNCGVPAATFPSRAVPAPPPAYAVAAATHARTLPQSLAHSSASCVVAGTPRMTPGAWNPRSTPTALWAGPTTPAPSYNSPAVPVLEGRTVAANTQRMPTPEPLTQSRSTSHVHPWPTATFCAQRAASVAPRTLSYTPSESASVVASVVLGAPGAPVTTAVYEKVGAGVEVGVRHTNERIVEVPQIQTIQREVPVPQYVIKEFIREQPRPVVRTVDVPVPHPVIQTVERVVEVPQVMTQQRLVPFPQVVTEEVVRQVPVPMTQEVHVPVPQMQVQTVEKCVEVPQVYTVERPYPVPQVVTREVVVPVAVPQVQTVDVPFPHPVVQMVERYVEVPQRHVVEKPYPVPQVSTQEVLKEVFVPQVQVVNVPVPHPCMETVEKLAEVPQVPYVPVSLSYVPNVMPCEHPAGTFIAPTPVFSPGVLSEPGVQAPPAPLPHPRRDDFAPCAQRASFSAPQATPVARGPSHIPATVYGASPTSPPHRTVQ
mmetsp:Transcript_32637/g.87618  ORF Transcript_32637/g.87618 Transcript_32637/m.87618 type:complete len:516 (-) Transcript_32637:330-1877(-)|eukprot:CAMPEP_0194538768 /NCGR_PEP_ID=MMETSP0253-20130528/78439_1 /TAXON_ID=2966 /ORGANISM="Noctiluca scintillans" /LENGTH=515 /DNA_ID=CAMNT_0039384943 /DNA_START=87 /DNA_END=1634 /DNA_ORIENTATION=-